MTAKKLPYFDAVRKAKVKTIKYRNGTKAYLVDTIGTNGKRKRRFFQDKKLA
jgi:hypothetical protein